MTVDQIRYFLEIAKCRSLLDASKNLHITQPTLSRQMSNIEKDLNVQLVFPDESWYEIDTGRGSAAAKMGKYDAAV